MPPETKPVINSLAEMTCENCIYSEPHEDKRIRCHSVRADDWDIYYGSDFCSKGKWLLSEVRFDIFPDDTPPYVTEFDDCYYLFKDAK